MTFLFYKREFKKQELLMGKISKSSKYFIGIIIFLVVTLAITLISVPYIRQLSNPETRQKFIQWITSLGIRGWLIVLGIQVLQIIVAFIPGGPIEILAGILYGGFGGLLTCLCGSVLASFCAFSLAKKFGTPLIARLFNKNDIEKFSFLQDSRKLETIVFILFLIPGTPKDMLTYLAGTSPIKTSRFLIIATFARIPAVILSTFIGSSARHGEWKTAVLIFVITAVIGLLGILYKDKLIDACRQLGKKITHREDEN